MKILYTEPTVVFSHAKFSNVLIWIAVVIILLVVGIYFAANYNYENLLSYIGAIFAALAVAFFFTGLVYLLYGNPGPNKYGVIISEEYSLEELQENYIILEQKGLLYIVTEKEE